MATPLEDLRNRVYGDGPGELTIEDMLRHSGMYGYEGEQLDFDAANPVYESLEEWEQPAVDDIDHEALGDVPEDDEAGMNMQGPGEMAKQMLLERAQRRNDMSEQFQQHTKLKNKQNSGM